MGTAAGVTTRAGAVGLLSLAGVTTRAGTVGSTLVLDWAAAPVPVRNALGIGLGAGLAVVLLLLLWVSPCLGARGAAARARSAHVLDMSSAGTSVPPWIVKF